MRKEAKLSKPTESKLAGYALAAGAALAFAPGAAQADIIVVNANQMLYAGQVDPISFDGSMTAFSISDQGFSHSNVVAVGYLMVPHAAGNYVMGTPSGDFQLQAGARIGPEQQWTAANSFMGNFVSTGTIRCAGQWGCGGTGNASNGENIGYLGLRFQFDGQTRYGWAEVQAYPDAVFGGYDGTLISYAYETNPNVGISAGQTQEATPEPGTLGLLALGSLGLGLWRKRNKG